MINLLTNGCSFTWGGSLLDSTGSKFRASKDSLAETQEESTERLSLVWPHHLGKLLKADSVVNLSYGCGSNQRIFRSTVDWVNDQTPEVLKNTSVVIQLTEPSRFEFYYGNEDRYENDKWAACKTHCVVNHPDAGELTDYANNRISTYTEIEGFYSTLSYLLSFEKIFESVGISKYYFWFMRGGDGDFISQWLENKNIQVNSNLLTIDEFDTISHEDGHPNTEGHKQIAHMISEKM